MLPGDRWRASMVLRAKPPGRMGNFQENAMRVSASVKKICRNCKIIRRKGVVRVICTDLRHKQRQG